jgi:ParB family chromosome partitioning protein
MAPPRKALGKGLSALIPTDGALVAARRARPGEPPPAPAPAALSLSVDQLRPNPDQPRKKFDATQLEELAASIADRGVIQPLLVTRGAEGEPYTIVAGERRWRAARQAGLKEVPVVVRDVAGPDIIELALIENLQRQDLDPLDEALAFKGLIDDYGYTQEELARRLAKSRSAVANALRLLNLSAEVKELVAAGALSAGHARALLALEEEAQLTAARAILARGLNVREAETLVRDFRAPPAPAREPREAHQPSPQVRRLSEELQRTLGTKVSIHDRGKKGQVVIEYFSYDDLDRLVDRIMHGPDAATPRAR